MRLALCYTLFILIAALPAVAQPAAPADLRCEYLHNPLGIDECAPRLSWVLPTEADLRQAAYQVLVASTPAQLAQDQGDRWDSGKVDSDQSAHVVYQGAPLKSHQACCWKIRFWDAQGRPSPWSAPAHWSMGLLKPEEWQAAWIGLPESTAKAAPVEELLLDGGNWIWAPKKEGESNSPKGTCYFRRLLKIPTGKAIESARCAITVDSRFRLFVNGHHIGDGCRWKWGRCFDIAHLLQTGPNIIAVRAESGGNAGLTAKIEVRLEGADPLRLDSDATWKTRREEKPGWTSLACPEYDWQDAEVLGPVGMDPWGMPASYPAKPTWDRPSPLLRKTFSINKPIERATLYVCGLGFNECRLNGEKIGDRVLDPPFTRFDKRALYATYDLSKSLINGKNTLGIMLGNGWLNMHARAEWDFDTAPWKTAPQAIAQLRLEYADGSIEQLGTDTTWQATEGPIRYDCIRNGEVYDARFEQQGWDTPGFDAAAWASAVEKNPPKGRLEACMMPPAKVQQVIKPVSITEPLPGIFLADMGQNLSGWVRLRVEGEAGQCITLKHDERITDTGLLDQRNAVYVHSGTFQTDSYTLKGGGLEVWEPRFTYNGFQYLQIEGFPGTPTAENIEVCVVHTDFESPGRFDSSSDLFNWIHQATAWSFFSNYVDGYPTDCPHREKNGWTGDAHLAANQAFYNHRPTAAYTKWLNDFIDVQKPEGDFPGIIPSSSWGYGIGPSWDCAYLLLPYYCYLYRGDTRLIERHFETMKHYVDYLGTRAKDHIVSYGLGDWVPAKVRTPAEITSTAYYYTDAKLLGFFAGLIGKEAEAQQYTALAAEIKAAFNKTFFEEKAKTYRSGTQTALACALYQGLVPEAYQADIVEKLVRRVKARENHLDGGILGTKYLLHALSDNGHADLAYAIASQKDFPSWGYWRELGATTLWENWNGEDSRNHVMFGDVDAWFYSTLAGIQPDPEAPGFKHIFFKPHPVGDLRFVEAACPSIYGEISAAWKREGSAFSLTITVPANTTATLYLPGKNPAAPTEGVTPQDPAEGCTVFEVKPGTYTFTSTL